MDIILKYFPQLLSGAVLSVKLVLLSGIIGLCIAIPMGIARTAESVWVRAFPCSYVFFFRGTPLLIQLFLVYYGLGQFDMIRASILWPYLSDAFWCALLVMSLHTAAYITEILRGAIQALPPGEIEAARSLGMSKALTFRRIILPRAARIALPAYSNEVVLMLKGSALASTITLLELMGATQKVISRSYKVMEFLLLAGVMYLVLAFLLIQTFRLVEHILNRHQRTERRA